jgi:hypothetical protein
MFVHVHVSIHVYRSVMSQPLPGKLGQVLCGIVVIGWNVTTQFNIYTTSCKLHVIISTEEGSEGAGPLGKHSTMDGPAQFLLCLYTSHNSYLQEVIAQYPGGSPRKWHHIHTCTYNILVYVHI